MMTHHGEGPSMFRSEGGPVRNENYTRIEQALWFMERHHQEQPSLEEMAASVNLSKYHFQRVFTRWAGITPGRFLQTLTLDHARRLLEDSHSVLDTSLEVGLSGPGRLHDLMVTHEAITPGQFKSRGEGLRIAYGFHGTPFGEFLVMLTDRGICGMAFVGPAGREATLAEAAAPWAQAALVEEPGRTAATVARVFRGPAAGGGPPLHLVLHGTNFQVRVWEALLRVPAGGVTTYEGLAARIGRPGAARAVGQAVARNPVAYLIPCHRVIRKLGVLGGYRWGAGRKRLLLAWEAARTGSQAASA
jgi:AraC family transcriptional regulator of adaptative response/methylated-DNA-[protein]-cysteine methyltransferase